MLEDHRIFVLYKDKLIAESILSKGNKAVKREKKIEKLLNQREYIQERKVPQRIIWIPPVNHPWRKFVYGKRRQQLASVS